MPDWERMLRAQLGGMRLEPAARDEIIAHLEESYERLLALGISEEEALQRTRAEFSNDRDLARNIWRAKRGEQMNSSSRQIWVPGLVITGVATLSLTVLQLLRMRQMALWPLGGTPTLFYVPWLLGLPVLGFVGAYWSRRVGAGTRASIIAGVFPSLFYAAFPYLTLPLALVVDRGLGPVVASLGWFVFVSKWYLLNWAVLPCVALLTGALPGAMIARGHGAAPQTAA